MDPQNLDVGAALDRRWFALRGEMDVYDKQDALVRLAAVFDATHTPYAIIGGVALQVHVREPRTTLDIDVAVSSRAILPRDALVAAGFTLLAEHAHTVNYRAGDGTPIQFSDDPPLAAAVGRAQRIGVMGVSIPFMAVGDLLHEKLRAGADPARRRSKRLRDLADAELLLEEHPELDATLSEAERLLLGPRD